MRAQRAELVGRKSSQRLFSMSVMFCSREAKRAGETSIVMLFGLREDEDRLPLAMLRGRHRSGRSIVRLISSSFSAIRESQRLLLALDPRGGLACCGFTGQAAGVRGGLQAIRSPWTSVPLRKEARCWEWSCRSCQYLVLKRMWLARPLLLIQNERGVIRNQLVRKPPAQSPGERGREQRKEDKRAGRGCGTGCTDRNADPMGQYIIMEQQQQSESPLVSALLVRFEQDESEATRDLLDRAAADQQHRPDYLRAFNTLLNTRAAHSRQRRDLAAIARLIADAPLLPLLLTDAAEEAKQGRTADPRSLTMELTRLIANITNQNPHLVDNILASAPGLLPTLCGLFSKAESTPVEAESLTEVIGFLHNIALKETPLRSEQVAPCLEALLRNILTDSRFCPFIAHKKFQAFVSSLFKFHANVPLVALGAYRALVQAARALNKEYKAIGERFDEFGERGGSGGTRREEREAILEAAFRADRKLIAMMKLFEKARSNIFSRFNAFSFTPLLKIFAKVAIMRPVALLNQPIENKLIVNIIAELIATIDQHRIQFLAEQGQPEEVEVEERAEVEPGEQEGEDEAEGEVPVPVPVEERPSESPSVQRFRAEIRYFTAICNFTHKFSDTYIKYIRAIIDTLCAAFADIQQLTAQPHSPQAEEAIEARRFLVTILTVRLERMVCMMMKLFPIEEMARGEYYCELSGQLARLLPSYFSCAVEAESRAITQQLPRMQQVTAESEGRVMRFIMESIDEESVKTVIQTKLLEKINIYGTIYEAILKFLYHLADQPPLLRHNVTRILHPFLTAITHQHIQPIHHASTLTLRQVEVLRLALRVCTELFHNSLSPSAEEEQRTRGRLYGYCRLLEEEGGLGVFGLLGTILNNLEKHSIEGTAELTDTPEHREAVIKTIFAKIIIQRAKIYLNFLTLAHANAARTEPELPPGSAEEREHINATFEGSCAYLRVMNDFVMQTAASSRHVVFKEDVVGTVASRTLEYVLPTPEGSVEAAVLHQAFAERMDSAAAELRDWMLAHSHLHIHRLPLLTRKVLHFEKLALPLKAAPYQLQIAHVQHFIRALSALLNHASLQLIGQKMDLKIKVKRQDLPRVVEGMGGDAEPGEETQRVANLLTMLAETIKLINTHESEDYAELLIAPNYLYSVLALIPQILNNYPCETLFPEQADQLLRASLWLIETYLSFDARVQQLRQEKEKALRRAGRQSRKDKIKEEKRKLKGLQIKPEGTKQQSEEEEKVNEMAEQSEEKQQLQRRRRNRKRKNKSRKQSKSNGREEPKTLNKSGSKTNLFDQSQVRSEPRTHQKPKRDKVKPERVMQNRIREYLVAIVSFLGDCPVAVVGNDTLSFLLSFLSRHMRRNLMQSPPYSFEVQLSSLVPQLLRVRVRGTRVPWYHYSLCKLGLQLFEDAHIKVDYELAIKRYLFEQEANEIPLSQFVGMLKENFKDVTHSTGQIVEIVTEGRRVPFTRDYYEPLLADRSKKATVVLKEGGELHLLAPRTDPSRRKPSEQPRAVKVSDYAPEGELLLYIEHLIAHSIRLLVVELDRYLEGRQEAQQADLEPFTIRSVLQALQYLVRESPSLGPFVAKFKCRRIILHELARQGLKHRETVSNFVLKAVGGSSQQLSESLGEVGYLSVLIRLFSPLVANVISGLVFELCLDSTPLVQVGEGKKAHVAFGSVIRLKVAEEVAGIMFDPTQLEWLYRKLCLLNLLIVLTNIREMARLFLEHNFIPRLYAQFEAVKREMTLAYQAYLAVEGNNSSPALPGMYVTRIITPFYLVPLAILQELNISFHYNKKLNKNTPRLSIATVLSRESINAQLIPADALKKYKFKLDWPFHQRRETSILEHPDPEDEDLYANEEASSDSDAISEEEESEDSSNSSFMRFDDRDLQLPEDEDLESYVSMDEPHEQLLNQEWEYSDDRQRPGDHQLDHYPDSHDHIIEEEPDDDSEPEDREMDEMDEEDEEDEEDDGSPDVAVEDEQAIEDYLQLEGITPPSPAHSSSLIHQLNALPSESAHSSSPAREFILNSISNEEEYYINVSALLNFEKVEFIPRISKAEKRQVHLLRFLLQLPLLPERQRHNQAHPRLMTSHETKEEAQVAENALLLAAFRPDLHYRAAEAVEYSQIYRYDHFHREYPKLTEELERTFADHLDLPRRFPSARRNAIVSRDNLIEILPGWNITEVVNEPPSSGQDIDEEHPIELRRMGEEEDESHIQIDSQEEEEEEGEMGSEMGSEMEMEEDSESPEQVGAQVTEAQHLANITEILRAANFAMTAREFMRLDRGLQQDILLNIAERPLHEQPEQSPQQNGTPNNSPASFVEPADQDAVDVPRLDLAQQEDPLAQGRIEPLSEHGEPSADPSGPEPQLAEMEAEGGEGAGEAVGEVYRKMSLEHSKKVSKDVMEALNKDGKNNSKFHEVSPEELANLLDLLALTSDQEHAKFPYPLLETLCINTLSLRRIASALIALLAPPQLQEGCSQPSIPGVSPQLPAGYCSVALKTLHLLAHLTKNYSIAMALLRVNNDVPPTLAHSARREQAVLSSFEMLILLLRERALAESPALLGFLIAVLDNITMHHFYKNVHEIVERTEEEEHHAHIGQDSVFLLGELLQSDYVSDSLPLVSKIIMRLSVEPHNLANFINYLQQLVRQLTDQALAEITRGDAREGPLKIVNIMSIFYEMVRAFETFPTSLDRHQEVMLSMRRIVEYEKLQELCNHAVRAVFEEGSSVRAGEAVDCFFILHEIATITRPNRPKTEQQEDEHNQIAGLGEVGQTRREGEEGEELWLGCFNLSQLWREAGAHANFKQFINASIRRRLTESARRTSPFDLPVVKIAAATPHLLSFDNKYALFKGELKRLRGRNKYDPIHIVIDRNDLLQTSYEQLGSRSGEKLRGKLKVEFVGEEGQDAGGITREWFQLFSRAMLNPNWGLFIAGSAGHTYHPSSTSYINDRHLDYFKFIGRVAGKALYDGYLLDAYFTPAFYKHILALPINYRDMEQEDYEYFKSLTWILENAPIQDFLELTFTYDSDNFGAITTKELIPNGAEVTVNEQNKLQYVQLIAYAKMATSIQAQLEAFLTGLHELVPHRLLRFFSEKELEIMISGRPTIDIEDLRRNTELVNYMRNDPIIVWLFEVLEGFDMELRTAFIQFVTGSSRVPVEGFKDLRGMNGVQRFNIHREFQEERLPRAHTCFNQLDLPSYKSKEVLLQKLMYAITEGKEGFGMI